MIYIPFIYFSGIAYLAYKRNHRFDIATLIACIYAISGLFSILMMSDGQIEPKVMNCIDPISTFVYCFLLSFVLFPFINNSNSLVNEIRPLRNEKLLKILAWAAFIWFLILVVFSFSQFKTVITGDMGEMRSEIYNGTFENKWFTNLPRIIQLVLLPFNMLFGCPWILAFFAFFSRYIQKLPIKYFLFFFLASISGPWNGILGVDRSAMTYWVIAVFALYLFFLRFMSREQKKGMNLFLMLTVVLAGLYLVVITVSRFSAGNFDDLERSNSSVHAYLGQVFPNFCYFLEDFSCPWKTLGIIFPFINQYVFGGITGAVSIQQHIESLTHIDTGLFYSFIGQIVIAAGIPVAVLYCIFINRLSSFFLRPFHNHRITCLTAFYFMLFSSVMFLGVFLGYYTIPARTFSVVAFIILIRYMERSDSTKPNRRCETTNNYEC